MIPRVFENENYLVMDKPALTLAVPPRFADGRKVLGLLLQAELKRQIFPVHRLDWGVSGLIIYALNSEAHRRANGWFARGLIVKKYHAKTERHRIDHLPMEMQKFALEYSWSGQEELWVSRILRGKKRSYLHPQGDLAKTRAVLLRCEEGNCFWSLWPLTGRPHQLRLELSRRGYPILGDVLYGSSVPLSGGEIALRCCELDLQNVPPHERGGLPEKISLEGFL
ncbi:MAG: RNA pseudouridine synthase [Bdellovibrionaceae bacterium]|nr:RNA pseudouridine synthase [Pseudobdellovibrionaceae bacterium]